MAAQYASYQAQLRQVMEKWKAVDGVIYIRTSVDTAMEIVHRLYQKKKSLSKEDEDGVMNAMHFPLWKLEMILHVSDKYINYAWQTLYLSNVN